MGKFLAALVGLAVFCGSGAALAFKNEQEARAYYLNLANAEGAVPWNVLSELEMTYTSPGPGMTSITWNYTEALKALDGTEVRIMGFIYPLESGREQSRFLLSAYPPGCPFCLPAGPRELVEVQCAEPVVYSSEPVMLSGRFELLENDPGGMFYRLHGARAVGR